MSVEGPLNLTRRSFLTAGAAGLFGLHLLPASASARTPQARSVILLWMDGGPSPFETFDPKPEAPSGIRGEFGAIPTTVPGLRISELMPRMARQMKRCALVRSVSHDEAVHERACHLMLTGFPADSERVFPSLGSIASRGCRRSESALPYAALPSSTFAFGYARSGFLGEPFDPVTPGAVGARPQRAFDIEVEPARLRERYGEHAFGRNCLRARRLVEGGTRFVTVSFGGWDTHSDIAAAAGDWLVPPLDQAMSALIEDLHQRGLLETTLVVWLGDFGRSPRINPLGGRDHWPRAGCALFAGGGTPWGNVIGSTDSWAEVTDRPTRPEDLCATILGKVGIPSTYAAGAAGRPIRELC